MKQKIQYCTTADGAKIAYSVTGNGPPIIRTSHWLTHLEHDFKDPVWRHVLLGLNTHHTLIRYDPRGEGMSQRDRTDIDFDAWMLDLEAVVAAVNPPTFALFGCSQGASTAIAYAAAHPERVSHLILYGAFAKGPYTASATGRELIELAKTMMRMGWGLKHEAHRQWFTSLFMPDGTPELYHAYNRMQQLSASAETAILHLEATASLDVTDQLPRVKTPTLVLHCRDDVMIPFRWGQEVAASIPGARMAPLEGRNHLFMAGSEAHRAFIEATYDFLAVPRPKGHLPGEATALEFWERRGRRIDQNGLIKLVLLILAILGAVISAVQTCEALGG